MASRTHQLLAATVVLGAVQLISGYSFNNCIEDPGSDGTNFKCIHRKEKNMSAIINDLPPSAVTLNISDNPVWCIPNRSFAKLPNLQHLRIDHNNHLSVINQFAFQHLHRLKSLNVSFNNISKLRPLVFQDLHNLTFLSLANNTLQELPGGIFSTLLHLETLILRENLLSNFTGIVESVSNLTNLKELDLCFNNLTSLSHSSLSLPRSLIILSVCGNNLFTLGCKDSFLRPIKVLNLSFNRRLSTKALEGVDLSCVRYLSLRSTRVDMVEFLNISNVNRDRVDFSGTGLENDTLVEVCKLVKTKVDCIKNLRLSYNHIGNLTNSTLYYCPNITGALDLSHNNLKNTGCLNFLQSHSLITSFAAEHNNLTLLQSCKNMGHLKSIQELSYRYNRILLVESFAFSNTPNIKTLQLNINCIAYLDRTALKDLKQLETLRLDNNLLTDLFDVTFEDNLNLQTLNLRNNHISVIFDRTFHRLRNLTILDLGGNKITHFQQFALDGLESLSKFYLDGNHLKQIDTSLYGAFQDTLTTLDLHGNQISFLREDYRKNISPFMNLSKLSDLKLDSQRPHGLSFLPPTLFRGLHSLKSLYLTNNNIFYLAPESFDDLTGLRFLTLDACCVGVTQLQPGVFKNLRNLTKLTVENMGIQNITKDVFRNLTQLQILQINHNVMQEIDVDALKSLPKLKYIDLRSIPLSCTCKNNLLQNWTVHNPDVQVVYLYSLPCPHDAKHKFHNFDTNVCYIDLGKFMFLSTAVVIFLFTVTPLLYVKLYWKMKYGYYVFRSWFGEQWRRLREEEENCKYDAFISYNSSDEQWVMEQLMPNLEGNGSSFKLCLHHRDFELGRDIVDNIVSAVYSSRKTICVVSRNFLRSEWCSLEIQLASYRLFDEHRDVLLLVFLEPISERQVSSYHRMRKVMLKKTYLQWPGSDCTNPGQAQELFWSQLRRAMRTGSRLEEENDGEGREKEEEEYSETEASDENCYLQP